MSDRTSPRPADGRHFVIGLCGGSGAVYALRLLEVLLQNGAHVDVIATDAGRRVLLHEMGMQEVAEGVRAEHLVEERLRERLEVYDLAAVESTPASGSAAIDAVILCPCSMGTLARVAHGFSSNLVERSADVALKEGRTLVVVPRESPLSEIHLENMLKLRRAGAIVLPAMPGFYHRPESVADLVDFIVARILDQIGVSNGLVDRWKTPDADPSESPFNEGESGR